jgi:large subunit ribosomal protein L9
MKVLLKKNVAKLGKIGDVVDVKDGYARNYLLPHRLAVEPTDANLRTIEAEKQRYREQLARQHDQLEAKAALIRGKEITITARANVEGHLYGSVGPAQISAVLAEDEVFVEPKYIALDEPIRTLDKYDVQVSFSEDVHATIHVWVVPAHETDVEDEEDQPSPEAHPAEGEQTDQLGALDSDE